MFEFGDVECKFSDNWKWVTIVTDTEVLAVKPPLRSASAASEALFAVCYLGWFAPRNQGGIPTYTRHINFPFLISTTNTLLRKLMLLLEFHFWR